MTASPKMDDDGLGLKTVLSNCDAKRDHNYRLGADNFTITTREYAVLCEALAALESRSEVLEEAAKVCDAYQCDHPGGMIVAGAIGRAIRELAPRAEPGAPTLEQDSQEAYHFAEHEPNAAERVSSRTQIPDAGKRPASAAPEVDVKGMVERLRGRGRELAGSTLITGQDDAHTMFSAAALLERLSDTNQDARCRVAYARGLEEAAKVVENCPASLGALERKYRELAAAIRTKIKPTRGES